MQHKGECRIPMVSLNTDGQFLILIDTFRYMVHSPKGDVRLGIGLMDKYLDGWYSVSAERKFNPSYDYTPPSQ